MDFGNYLAIPLNPGDYHKIAVDIKGDSGVIRNRTIQLEDIFYMIDETVYLRQKKWLADNT